MIINNYNSSLLSFRKTIILNAMKLVESAFNAPKISMDPHLSHLKIIMLHQSLEMGGAERQGLHLAKWLRDAQGADIEVWGFGHPGSVSTWCDTNNIPWRLLSWDWNGGKIALLKGLLQLFRELKCSRPDVLLPYTMPPNIACGLFWRMVGAKTCIWNQRDEGRHRFSRWLEKKVVQNTPWFICNSSHASDFLEKDLGVCREKIEVIHNGIELPAAKLDRLAWRSKLEIPSETMVACMVANLHEYKDHPTLLRSWALAAKASGCLRPILLLAGHDYGKGVSLKSLSEGLGIADQVRFLGHVDDISGLLNASDIGLFSSTKEGMPNGVLECMAAGLPVVATHIPGTREALGADNIQFLTEPHNPATMAEAIKLLLNDKALRYTLGQRNFERVRKEFSIESMCGRYFQAIVRAVNCSREPLGFPARQ